MAYDRASGWVSRKFIRDQDHLLRRIGGLCGKVDPAALETIRLWPDGYVTWKAVEMKAPAGPDTDPRSAIWSLGDGGSPQDDDTFLAPAEAA